MSVWIAWAGTEQELLRSELDSAWKVLQEQPEKPHYVALALEDLREVRIAAELGALSRDSDTEVRTLDVDMRVGSPELDSTHPLRGFSAMDGDGRREAPC